MIFQVAIFGVNRCDFGGELLGGSVSLLARFSCLRTGGGSGNVHGAISLVYIGDAINAMQSKGPCHS